jgi:hypothetical protein
MTQKRIYVSFGDKAGAGKSVLASAFFEAQPAMKGRSAPKRLRQQKPNNPLGGTQHD